MRDLFVIAYYQFWKNYDIKLLFIKEFTYEFKQSGIREGENSYYC